MHIDERVKDISFKLKMLFVVFADNIKKCSRTSKLSLSLCTYAHVCVKFYLVAGLAY